MFITKCGNGSEEIAGRRQNNSLCQTNMSPGCNNVLHKWLLNSVKYLYLSLRLV